MQMLPYRYLIHHELPMKGKSNYCKWKWNLRPGQRGSCSFIKMIKEIIKESVVLEPGKNTFTFRTSATGNGLLKYEAKLIVPDDGFLENNRMLSITMMEQSPRVLVVQTKRNPSVIPSLLDQVRCK